MTRFYEALKEYPVTQDGYRLCTKEKPLPDWFDKYSRGGWIHKDAEETGAETETQVEYKCPHCGTTFWVHLGS